MEPIFKAYWNKEKCECGVETLRLMGALISMKASSYLKFQCVCDPRTWGKKVLPLFMWLVPAVHIRHDVYIWQRQGGEERNG